jgi:hypothetical protein
MSNLILQFLAASVLCLALFGFAFVAAPHSRGWGLVAYVWAGAGVVIVLLVMPFLMQVMPELWQRLLFSLCLGSAGAVVWVAGLVASNMRIIFRLI